MYKMLICLLFVVATFVPADAAKRVALVIGNSNYTSAPSLINPQNDANAIATALSKLGFEVIKGLDLNERQTLQTFNKFRIKLATADVALLFYAGHGLQVGGSNYLVPTDASLDSELDLQAQAMRLDTILNMMENPNRTSIVLLDACRDNPLARRLSRSMGTRSNRVGRGLARVETGLGTYIGFSTEPGNVALDGDGIHSPFALALLNNINRENLDIESVMRLVRAEVYEKTNGTQIPWGNSSLIGKGFVFKTSVNNSENGLIETPIPISPVDPVSPQSKNAEIAYWNSIRDAKNKGYFQAYLIQFPNGLFKRLAELKIEEIDRQNDLANKNKLVVTKLEAGDTLDAQSTLSIEKITDKAEIIELQKKLYDLNFEPGVSDGLVGANTKLAISNFQADIGRNKTGAATKGLLALLRNTKIPDNWGGLGFNSSNKRIYQKKQLPNRRATEAAILAACNGCRNILVFNGEECGALAMSAVGWGWAVRSNKAETKIAAINSCAVYGKKCKLEATVCANGK